MKKRAAVILTAFVMLFLAGFLTAREARADGNRTVEIISVTENSVTIRWEKPTYNIENCKTTVTGYKVYYGTSADKLQPYGKKLSASATQKKITGLTPKKKYYFQVKVGVRIVNESEGINTTDSTNYLETPMHAITLPGKITTLQVTSTDAVKKQVVFKWSAVNPNYSDFGYQYYVKTAAGKKKSAARVTTNGIRLKNIANTTYYLGKVRSFCKIENRDGVKYCYGKWSDWMPILSDPLVVAAGLPEGKLNVTWTEMKGVDGYDIYIFKEGWKKYYKAAYTAVGATSGTITKVNGKAFNLARNTSYEVSIVARKNYNGKNYYSRGQNSTRLDIN